MPENGVTSSLEDLIALRQKARFRLPQTASAMKSGQTQSLLRGRGIEFSEVRAYQAGDEVRHMDWRVTARTGRPHTKLFEEEKEKPTVLIADFNASMFFGTKVAFKSVIAAQLCALLAWQTFLQGDKVGGIFFNAEQHNEFYPSSREVHLVRLLSQLAKYTQQRPKNHLSKPKPLSQTLAKLRHLRPGALIVLISDFYALDTAADAHLHQLKKHHDLIAFHICDPIECTPPPKGTYPITDSQHALLLDTYNKQTAEAYEAFWSNRNQALEKRLMQLGLGYKLTQTTSDLPRLVQQLRARRRHGQR